VKTEPCAPGGMRRRFYGVGAGLSGRVGCGVFCVCRQARVEVRALYLLYGSVSDRFSGLSLGAAGIELRSLDGQLSFWAEGLVLAGGHRRRPSERLQPSLGAHELHHR
jgi:hypothetical protein